MALRNTHSHRSTSAVRNGVFNVAAGFAVGLGTCLEGRHPMIFVGAALLCMNEVLNIFERVTQERIVHGNGAESTPLNQALYRRRFYDVENPGYSAAA